MQYNFLLECQLRTEFWRAVIDKFNFYFKELIKIVFISAKFAHITEQKSLNLNVYSRTKHRAPERLLFLVLIKRACLDFLYLVYCSPGQSSDECVSSVIN